MPNPEENPPNQWNRREFVAGLAAAVLAGKLKAEAFADVVREVFIVPNFHPASCGWLTTFSKERVYCANSYLSHLDRVRDDPNYAFVMSEVNNVIAIMEFQPARIPELKQRIRERRVEIVNGYFLESAISLAGGEALVRQGVEGLRWYQKVFGITPRFSWNIDVVGTHDQMPQIAAGLGFEALIYTRKNPTGKAIYWSESPDGSRILTLSPGGYSEAQPIFTSKSPLTIDQLHDLEKFFAGKNAITPEGAPILILGGGDDYSIAPLVKQYPSLLQKQMAETDPDRKLKFATLSQYFDVVEPGVKSGATKIPTLKGGTAYDYDAFWIENPRVKTLYRSNEHALQAAEALAAIASLKGKYEYPVEPLSNCWILMCLNMDRNTIWGSAGGMVFENTTSWDALDRFNWVSKTTGEVFKSAGTAMVGRGDQVGFFNPLNWKRNDPVAVTLPAGKSLEGTPCEALPDGTVLCRPELPSISTAGWKLSPQAPESPRSIDFPPAIETRYYLAVINGKTGAISSLKFKSAGRELLAAPANVIVAERPTAKMTEDPGDKMPPRPERTRLASSNDHPSTIQVTQGVVATTVAITGTFYGGGALRRVVRFYHDYPRIDFETELNDLPNFTVVVSEFPLAEDILEVRRAIPYGFSHGAWSQPNPDLHGWTKGIVPAVRWIDFSLAKGGGFAIFDRGLSGRELNERIPVIYLLNAEDKYAGYENAWLSGKGKHVLAYSVVAHESAWKEARIAQMAWEYNREPVVIAERLSAAPQSFLETSDNVIVEALRREGDHIQVRLVECLGTAGTVTVKLDLPHRSATLTDLTGRKLSTLPGSSPYTFPVRPQQIVTLHFATPSTLAEAAPVKSWDAFVPQEKLPTLHAYDPKLIGHPPFGE